MHLASPLIILLAFNLAPPTHAESQVSSVSQSLQVRMQTQIASDARRVFTQPTTRALILNRPHLRAAVTEDQITFSPQGPGWSLVFKPTFLNGKELAPGLATAEAHAIKIGHGGQLIHRLHNHPDRLEQTFTITANQGPEISLEATLKGPLTPRIADKALLFSLGETPVLRASAPRAFDANGREIPARFELDDKHLRIQVSDAHAYPILIDPAWEAIGENQSSAWYGFSISAAGDVNRDGFDDLLVAAPFFHAGNPSAGKIYLYYGSADGISETPAWSSMGANENRALFGWSVAAIDVNQDGYSDLVVGAPSRSGTGKAYCFHGSFNGPLPAAWETTGDNAVGAFFGTSVAAAGDVNQDGFGDVIVGAPAESFMDGPSNSPGKAFVYHGGNSGLSASPAWTSTGEDQPGAGFGWSVASAGDVNGDGHSDVLVGANLFDMDYNDTGRAYLYLGGAGGLSSTAAWADSGDAQAGAQYGWSVASAGDVNSDTYFEVAIGAPGHDSPNSGAGRVYVYQGGNPISGLHPAYWWVDKGSGAAMSQFGFSVAGAGDVNDDGYADLLVGAPGDNTAAQGAGRAYLYHGSPSGPLSPAAFEDAGDEELGAGFGGCVAAAGDVNDDGAADFAIGAYAADGGETDSGKAFLYLGTPGAGPGVCEPLGTPCDDEQDCTHSDACDANGACLGVPFNCDDANPCTDDLCRPDGSCALLHNTAPCSDADPCTENDVCANAQCHGSPLDCSWLDDGCAQGQCNSASGQCQPSPAPDGTACDDGDPCTSEESCVGGVCLHRAFTCDEGGDGCGCGAQQNSGSGFGLLGLLWVLMLVSRARQPTGASGRET